MNEQVLKRFGREALALMLFAVCSTPGKTPLSWKPILSLLNRPPSLPLGYCSPETQSLQADLNRIYDKELETIGAHWEQERKKEGQGNETLAATRQRKNRFFYDQIQAQNRDTFQILETSARIYSRNKNYRKTAERVLNQVVLNPVARVENASTFDPTGEIGFCFGRAMLVHYLLLKAGVEATDIEKIFVVGDLELRGQLWRFHTTVLIRDAENGFLAVDPLESAPLPYKKWIAINANRDLERPYSRARFYVTDPRKLLPSYGAYSLKLIEDPILLPYFEALLKTMLHSRNE